MDTDEHRFFEESAISRELYAGSLSGGLHLAARNQGLEFSPSVSMSGHFCILPSTFAFSSVVGLQALLALCGSLVDALG